MSAATRSTAFLAAAGAALAVVGSVLFLKRSNGGGKAKGGANRPLLMIPGPTEFHDSVLEAMGEVTPSHVAPSFIEEYGSALDNVLRIFLAERTGSPFVLAGSGSLGWDMISANLCEPGKKQRALVVHTGYFSDSFADCLRAYGCEVDFIRAPAVGDTVAAEQVATELGRRHYHILALTHVDTSTGVRNDIKALAEAARKASPNTFIAVDGVCSFAAEEFRFDDWGIDAAMTGSQKALGVPPGLMVLVLSERALQFGLSAPAARDGDWEKLEKKGESEGEAEGEGEGEGDGEQKGAGKRTTPVASYYTDVKRWHPIMTKYRARQPCYFATPSVNLIRALHVASVRLLDVGMEEVFRRHAACAGAFRKALDSALGLKLVPARAGIAANTLSAIRYPEGVTGAQLLPLIKARGVVLAGGLHREIKAQYFRAGHMGVSVLENGSRGDLQRTLAAIEGALLELKVDGVQPKGTAKKVFDESQ